MNFAVHYLFGLLEVPVLSCFCLLQYFAWYFLRFITEAMPTHFRNRKSEVRGEVISILRFPSVTEGNPAPQILDYRLNILSTNVTQGILLAQTWETHQVIAGYQHWILIIWIPKFKEPKCNACCANLFSALCSYANKKWTSSVVSKLSKADVIDSDISFSCFPLKCPWCHRNRSEISAHCKTQSPAESMVMCGICIRLFTKSKACERRRKCMDPYSTSVPRDYSKTAETDGSNSLNVRSSNGTS